MMKISVGFILMTLILVLAGSVAAQNQASKEDTAANLRQQLIELDTKETQLRLRLEELEEALKPESIERALAGIGSTRPEELREHRRKLLTIERNGLQSQLKLIEESRTRTESAITAAQNASYLTYSQPAPTPSIQMALMPNGKTVLSGLRTIFLAVSVLIFLIGALVSIVVGRRPV